jgi:hypothetical protein
MDGRSHGSQEAHSKEERRDEAVGARQSTSKSQRARSWQYERPLSKQITQASFEPQNWRSGCDVNHVFIRAHLDLIPGVFFGWRGHLHQVFAPTFSRARPNDMRATGLGIRKTLHEKKLRE